MADSYVREIKSLEIEIRRLNVHLKKLRDQKKKAEFHLYNHMNRHNMSEAGGIKINKIQPKQRKKRKPERQRREETIQYFKDMGYIDADRMYDHLKQIQSN